LSLRLRLALFGAGVVALGLAIFGVLVIALLSRAVTTNQDAALKSRADAAVASLDSTSDLTPRAAEVPADLGSSDDVFVEVFDRGANLVYSTGELHGQPPLPSNAMLVTVPELLAGGWYETHGGFRYYGVKFDRGFVVTGQSTRVPQSNLDGVIVFFSISAVPALIAAWLASWIVAGRALRPLRSVAVASEAIGRDRDFGRRLPVSRTKDEVATFAASFNSMFDRLQDAYEAQKQFVSDASHELRTPLTTIQGNAGLLASRELAADVRHAAAADIVQESGRMARLVDRMLTLARADSGLRLARAPVELDAIVREVCRQAALAHPEMRIEADVAAAGVDGDEDALRQLLWILLDNATRYARSVVEVRLEHRDGWARLTVADDGRGVAAAERERIFERFYRVDGSRTGGHSGLGLAIARWIVTEHGGRIIAGDATLGGAAFLVDLPFLRAS